MRTLNVEHIYTYPSVNLLWSQFGAYCRQWYYFFFRHLAYCPASQVYLNFGFTICFAQFFCAPVSLSCSLLFVPHSQTHMDCLSLHLERPRRWDLVDPLQCIQSWNVDSERGPELGHSLRPSYYSSGRKWCDVIWLNQNIICHFFVQLPRLTTLLVFLKTRSQLFVFYKMKP